MTSLDPREEEKQYGDQLDPFGLLKFSIINKRWTFFSANKQFSWKRIHKTLNRKSPSSEQHYLVFVNEKTFPVPSFFFQPTTYDWTACIELYELKYYLYLITNHSVCTPLRQSY